MRSRQFQSRSYVPEFVTPSNPSSVVLYSLPSSFCYPRQLSRHNLCVPCTRHQHPSSHTARIHSFHMPKPSQQSDPLYTPTLYSCSSTYLVIPNSLFVTLLPYFSNTSSQEHSLFVSLHFWNTRLCPIQCRWPNIIITPWYMYFFAIPNLLFLSNFFSVPHVILCNTYPFHILHHWPLATLLKTIYFL